MSEVWVALIGTLVIQAVGVIYVYGKLSQANAEHARRLDRLESEQDDQWNSINAISNRVAELHGRRSQ